MAEHELKISRYQRGQQTYGRLRGAAGMGYGTSATCSCGGWSFRLNVAPSKGGRREAEHQHERHVRTETQAEEPAR